MKYLLLKDKKRRILYALFEKRKKVIKALVQNFSLSTHFRLLAYKILMAMPKNSSITRIRNRCLLTNRPRAVYKKFGMSRLMFRKNAWQGNLIGVKKASW